MKNAKSILLFFIVYTFSWIHSEPLSKTNPADIILCWDIHDTLLESKTIKRAKMGLKTGWLIFKSKTARKVLHDAKKETGDLSGEYLAYQFLNLAHENTEKAYEPATSSSEGKKLLHKASRYRKLAHLFGSFELQYTIMPGIIELIQSLHANNYTHHYVASNISSGIYPQIKVKFPEIFNSNMIQDGLVANPWEKPIIKKPNVLFFIRLKKMLDPENKKNIIFIDDNEKNVKAAEQEGLIGIQFKSAKSLNGKLKKLGIHTGL